MREGCDNIHWYHFAPFTWKDLKRDDFTFDVDREMRVKNVFYKVNMVEVTK